MANIMLNAAKITDLNIDTDINATNEDRYFSNRRPTKEKPWYGLRFDQKYEYPTFELKPTPEKPWQGLKAGEKYEYPTWTHNDITPRWVMNHSGYVKDANLIIDEIDKGNINDVIHNSKRNVRCACAIMGIGLDVLVFDEDWDVRWEVARQGYGLDKLVDDDAYEVSSTVIELGYGLDKFINKHDDDGYARTRVAETGYGLDKLIWDKNPDVRLAVAKQAYGWDLLTFDENPKVRKYIASQGYNLDIFYQDKNPEVRKEVAYQGYKIMWLLGDEDEGVQEAIEYYFRENNLDEDKYDDMQPDYEYPEGTTYRQKCSMSSFGIKFNEDPTYHTKNGLKYADEYIRGSITLEYNLPDNKCLYRLWLNRDICRLVNHENSEIRKRLAAMGCGLNKLIREEDECIVSEVKRFLDSTGRSIYGYMQEFDHRCYINPKWLEYIESNPKCFELNKKGWSFMEIVEEMGMTFTEACNKLGGPLERY